jgi:hypothetical protein
MLSMGASENRMVHFKAIVDSEYQMAGGTEKQRRAAAYRAVAAATGLDYAYIYQLYTGRKDTIGDEAASKLDSAYADGKPEGWIDLPPEQPPAPAMQSQGEPTLAQAVAKLAALLKPMDEEARNMVSTTLSNLCRNPAGVAKAVANIQLQVTLSTGEDPPDPAPSTSGSSESAAARARPPRAHLSVKHGGGQKMQLDLPLRKTVANPFDKNAEPPSNERDWYEVIKRHPKASDG